MQAWDAFVTALEQKMGKEVIDRWVRPLKVVHFDACNLTLEPESSFQVDWFETHVRPIAKREFQNNNGRLIKISFQSGSKKKATGQREEKPPPFSIEKDPLDPSQTLENFIPGSSNEMIVHFFENLEPGTFNPIFLYGPNGVGKTHLLMGVAHLLEKKKGLSVFYAHAETFTHHVVQAIRTSQMRSFRQIYRNQDVLILDDAHHFARKWATQEELFHTFNELHTQGKQIILSSHLSPSRLDEIEPRLVSRFEWGIVLQLAALPPSEMKEVLEARAKALRFPLSSEVSHFLLDAFSSSSKAMMRALDALMVRHRTKEMLSLREVEHLLKDLLEAEEQVKLTPDRILEATSAYFGIRRNDILSKSQAKECAFPRKLAMFLCRKELKLPYLAIGKFFDRDHSTVMSSIKLIEKSLDEDEVETALSEIRRHFQI